METDYVYTCYTDFLKDKKFIKWQLMPDETLNTYWDGFLRNNPEREKDMQQAITYLKKVGLSKCNLNEIECKVLYTRIHKSIRQVSLAKRLRILWFSFSSTAAIVVIMIGITIFTPQSNSSDSIVREHITGELYNNEYIQLIANRETVISRYNMSDSYQIIR